MAENSDFVPEEDTIKSFKNKYVDSEVVFGLVAAIGTDLDRVIRYLKERLNIFRYDVCVIEISDLFLEKLIHPLQQETNQVLNDEVYSKKDKLMDLGTCLRSEACEGYLAMAVINHIQAGRVITGDEKTPAPRKRMAYIIKSLKNTAEVEILRTVYGPGFYLIGVYQEYEQRKENLRNKGILHEENITKLMEKDEDENKIFGQQSRDTYQLSDFFIDNTSEPKTKANVHRLLDLIFGQPFITPTFGEYAMFMAYCSSLRSADLSRQIGAVVCKNDTILASGANDCPKSGGGLYWPYYDKVESKYCDHKDGRDYMLGYDTNKVEFVNIARNIFEVFNIDMTPQNFSKIKNTSLGRLTEYGRVVHAEMEAIASCARNSISCQDAEIYVTTFPCHNCAKHLIAAGIKKVVYIEPYVKSKTLDFYKESIAKEVDNKELVSFIPFFGVGPRRFIELFAMNANNLPERKRKRRECDIIEEYGKTIQWDRREANIRSQMFFTSYLEREVEFSKHYCDFSQKIIKKSSKEDVGK